MKIREEIQQLSKPEDRPILEWLFNQLPPRSAGVGSRPRLRGDWQTQGHQADQAQGPEERREERGPVVPAFDESKWLVEEAMGTSSGDLLWICQEEPDDAHATMVALIREVAKLRADVLQLRTLLGDA